MVVQPAGSEPRVKSYTVGAATFLNTTPGVMPARAPGTAAPLASTIEPFGPVAPSAPGRPGGPGRPPAPRDVPPVPIAAGADTAPSFPNSSVISHRSPSCTVA